jgi:hypothetical protein
MKRIMTTVCAVVVATLLLGSIAAAWTPPGQRGYEGQPGNQGSQNSN